ncbi:MAG: leucine-rich repeat domain-containing protein [Bacillota bacterium]
MKKYKAGNVTLEIGNEETRVIIASKYLKECIQYVNSQSIKSLSIDFEYYNEQGLDFLKECPNVEKILIDNPYLKDFSGIYHLEKIKVLIIMDGKANLDFTKISSLELLKLEWNKKVSGLGHLINLKSLEIKSYKPHDGTLSELTNLSKLEELILNHGSVNSLDGLKDNIALKSLGLYYLKNLHCINEIILTNVQELIIENCKKIGNIQEIKAAKELEKIILSDCGEIDSLKFILGMKKLKFLSFVGTNILDGDISPCIGLEYVGFINKKHYSHKYNFFN